MSHVKLSTTVEIQEPTFEITHDSRIVLVGSCFATCMGGKLSHHKFATCTNPYGVLFNPASIANAITSISGRRTFTRGDLVASDNLWHSFSHHGSFSSPDPDTCLEHINSTTRSSHEELRKSTVLVITLGTAHVWKHIERGQIVSNCHKIPGSQFEHLRLGVQDTIDSLQTIIREARAVSPGIAIIFTVSPVRYLNRGAHENQLSKATLLLAVEDVMRTASNCSYFPSYEILVDELRDYRFYAGDMTHPSDMAVEYIWEQFSRTFFNDATVCLNQRINRIQQALGHTELHPDSLSAAKFRQWLRGEIALLERDHPGIWSRR